MAASSEAAKRVYLDNLDIDVVIQARVRHTTVIVLPEQENILDLVAGDTETWAVTGAANVAYIKPGEEGVNTNVALICASGNIYSFKVFESKRAETDLIVYVDYAALEKDKAQGKRPEPHEPKFISKMDVAIYQEAARQAERNARAAWDQADRRMQRAIDEFRSSYPTLIRFEYKLHKKALQAPFEISGMWHDGRFTYVRSNAVEAPALYESRDGKPSLVVLRSDARRALHRQAGALRRLLSDRQEEGRVEEDAARPPARPATGAGPDHAHGRCSPVAGGRGNRR